VAKSNRRGGRAKNPLSNRHRKKKKKKLEGKGVKEPGGGSFRKSEKNRVSVRGAAKTCRMGG